MSTVNLQLESRPESLLLVRSMLAGVADFLRFDPELLHNLKAVVSEACNNVVLHAYEEEPGGLVVALEIGQDEVEAVVRDWGRGIQRVAPSEDRMHVGLAVISAIADRAQFIHVPEGGTEVRMAFTGQSGIRILEPQLDAEHGEHAPLELSGDAIATLSPVGLLAGVLGRLAAAVAARAHFSLDRFYDVYLLADVIAAHAEAAASSDRISLGLAARNRRLELALGPFRSGSGARPLAAVAADGLESALSLLAVELAVEPVGDTEIWHLLIVDAPGP